MKMNKPVRITLIGLGIVIGLLLAMAAAYMAVFKIETNKMSPLATKEITPGIYAVDNGFVNLYLVKGDGGYIAIDAGNDADMTAREMKKLNIDPESVAAVFLTHADADHTASVKIFTSAKVFLSKTEKQMIDGSTHRFFVFNNTMEHPYETLNDGQAVTVKGISVKGIAAPGHTPGSMCYIVNGRNLFTGDTLSLHDGKADLFNTFFNMDSEMEKLAIGKLAALTGLKSVFTAHYGFTDDFAKAFKGWGVK